MITGWGTSTRFTKIIIHYYSEEDGLPLCRTRCHRRGKATLPQPNWDPSHPATCHICKSLYELRDYKVIVAKVS
jgi:hypothetical protein